MAVLLCTTMLFAVWAMLHIQFTETKSVAMGPEETATPYINPEEGLKPRSKPVGKAKKEKKAPAGSGRSKKREAPLADVSEIVKDEMTCSRCLWSARAFRTALIDKMPKKVKEADKRKQMTKEAFEATGTQAICHPSKFPAKIKRRQHKSGREYIQDYEVQHDDDSRYSDIEVGMEEVLKDMRETCKHLSFALADQILDRVAKTKERYIPGVLSDRWVCIRATRLCPKDEVTDLDLDEDEDDDDGEL